MTHLVDTDTVSIWQNATGPDYARFAPRLGARPPADVVVSVVNFHEQMAGAQAFLNRPRPSAALVRGYARLERLRQWYHPRTVLPFDDPAAASYDNLLSLNLRVGTMDLRIAAIALSRNLTVVTRNARHFSLVPGLVVEDWTR